MLLAENGFAVVLRQFWLQAGQPSMRALARSSGRSAQMVNSTLHGETLPRSTEDAAAVVDAVVEAGAKEGTWPDPGDVRRRCMDAYRAENAGRASVRSALRRGAEARHRLGSEDLVAQEGRTPTQKSEAGRPVTAWDAVALGVHRPIAASACALTTPSIPSMPIYVRRDHDSRLCRMTDSARSAATAVVLVGGSSTGKTRSAVEAVRASVPDWRLVFPTTAARLSQLLEEGEELARTVIWLDELQTYLEGGQGERVAAALRELQHRARFPVMVIGSIWPRFWQQFTVEPSVSGRDSHRQARQFLRGVHRVNVPRGFTDGELRQAHHFARTDSRLRAALSAAGETRAFVQNLAGGPALIDAYDDAEAAVRAVLTVAMDAWRLGCRSPLPHRTLERAAADGLPGAEKHRGRQWFATALAETGRPVRGAIAPLSRVDVAGRPYYKLADYLAQHGYSIRHGCAPACALWQALVRAPLPVEDVSRLASAAFARGYYRYADSLWRRLANAGDTEAARRLAELSEHLGRRGEARRWRGRAATAGDEETRFPVAAVAPDGGNETEQPYRTPGSQAGGWLTELLVDGGHGDAVREWETGRPGAPRQEEERKAEADRAEPASAMDGLSGSPSPELAAGASLQKAWQLPLLSELLDEVAAGAMVERIWERAVSTGDEAAALALVERLGHLVVSRIPEQEVRLREAAGRGSRADSWALAGLLEGTGRVEQAEAVWRAAAESGEAEAMWRLADLLVSTERVEEAEEWWRKAADTDSDLGMMARLTAVLCRAGRVEDAERLVHYGRDPDGSPAEPWYD